MKIAICTPTREVSLARHTDAMIALSQALSAEGHTPVFHRQTGCALIEHARSALATAAHEWGADVQLFIDDDVTPTYPLQVVQMAEHASRLESIVAAPTLIGGGTRFNTTFLEPNPFHPRRLVKSADCGMGCTAIARSVFDAIRHHSSMDQVMVVEGQPHVWPFFRSILGDGVWMGEDTSFVERAKQALGASHIWADTGCVTEHWGMRPWNVLETARP